MCERNFNYVLPSPPFPSHPRIQWVYGALEAFWENWCNLKQLLNKFEFRSDGKLCDRKCAHKPKFIEFKYIQVQHLVNRSNRSSTIYISTTEWGSLLFPSRVRTTNRNAPRCVTASYTRPRLILNIRFCGTVWCRLHNPRSLRNDNHDNYILCRLFAKRNATPFCQKSTFAFHHGTGREIFCGIKTPSISGVFEVALLRVSKYSTIYCTTTPPRTRFSASPSARRRTDENKTQFKTVDKSKWVSLLNSMGCCGMERAGTWLWHGGYRCNAFFEKCSPACDLIPNLQHSNVFI